MNTTGQKRPDRNLTPELTEKLQREHLFQRALFATIPDLLWAKDVNGVYLSCNAAFERLYGKSEGEIIGKTDYDFVSKELADFFRDKDRKALAADESLSNEEWLTFAATGYRGLFETIKTPIRDETGNVIGVLGISRDITARRQAEKALKDNLALLSQAEHIARFGSWSLDLPEEKLVWSDEVFRMFGIPVGSEPLTYSRFLEFVHPDDRDAVSQAYEDSLREKSAVYEVEHRILRKDTGEIRYVLEKCEHTRDEAGAVVRSVGIVCDITERKKIEVELNRQLTELKRWYSVTLSREKRVIELKREVNALAVKLGVAQPYEVPQNIEADSMP